MTDIMLNGAAHSVAPASTLAELVRALSLSDQAVALAVNRSVVPRQRWHEHAIQPGDRIDVVRAIGGG
jgi:sulfur carrier protein